MVVAVIDGLRADHVSEEITPLLADFANGGLHFENAASNSSQPAQSLASFFTGRLPTAGGTIGLYEAEPHDETTTLAQYFERAGYYTGLLANQPAIAGAGFTKGFQEIDVVRAGEPLDDARLVQRASEFLEDAGDDRVFLYVHFAGPLASETIHGATLPQERADDARQAYQQAIRASDAQLARLVDVISSAGRAEKTLFIVTSLNGFELFEHGGVGAGWTVYEEVIRVPLVLRAGSSLPAATLTERVSLIDVMPTILALAGIEDDGAEREGEALFELSGEMLSYAPPVGARIAEVVIPERVIVRSLTVGGIKYIASSLWTSPESRHAVAEGHEDTSNAYLTGSKPLPPLWGEAAYEALFDLAADPGEKTNLVGAGGNRASELKAALEAYRARCADRGITPRLATQFEVAPDPETLQNLESLGYL